MQISYFVGVGLLLTIDLLACVHSQGMLYHNLVTYFSAKILGYVGLIYLCVIKFGLSCSYVTVDSDNSCCAPWQ